MSNNDKTCSCGTSVKLIFACSGSSDVGELADKTARELNKNQLGKMFCTAGVGAKISGMVKSAEAAEKILVIDGCPISCAKKCLENSNLTKYEYINLSELNMQKGKTPVSEENIGKIFECGKDKLLK